MGVKTFKYACYKMDQATEDELSGRLHAAHRYYNRLVELENLYRKNSEDIRRGLSREYAEARDAEAAADARLEEAESALRRARSRTSAAADTASLRDAVKVAREMQKACRAASNAARRTVDAGEDFSVARKKETDDHMARRKALYAEASDVWWGTKNAMVASLEASYASTPPYNRLSFRRWTRNGILAAQVQGGADVSAVLGGSCTTVQIARVPGKKRAVCRIRMDSDERRKPIWTEVPIAYHRELPDGARVMQVVLVRRQGYHYYPGSNRPPRPYDEWSVNLTLRCPEETKPCGVGAVGLDVGWRAKPDGSLRVAYWADGSGAHGELCLPPHAVKLFFDKHEAQSLRDSQFNSMRDELIRWLEKNPHPEALAEATKNLPLWASPARLLHVISTWTRFDGDAEIYTNLLAWRRQDTLVERDFVLRPNRGRNIRLDTYRNFAAFLGKKYSTIAVEDLNVSDMRSGPLPESDEAEFVPTTYRDVASVGLLLSIVGQQGRAEVVKLPPHGTTSVCHHCGSNEEFDRRELVHACRSCGREWDQDENAAKNLLATFSGWTADDSGKPKPKKKRPTRRDRRKSPTVDAAAAE